MLLIIVKNKSYVDTVQSLRMSNAVLALLGLTMDSQILLLPPRNSLSAGVWLDVVRFLVRSEHVDEFVGVGQGESADGGEIVQTTVAVHT
jgi:hypothetical protein